MYFKRKRLFECILILVMCMSLLAGCGGEKEASVNDKSDKETVKEESSSEQTAKVPFFPMVP